MAAMVALVVSGCADDAPTYPSQGVCDPRAVDCQELLAREVSDARGGEPFTLPPVEVLTESELRARFTMETMAHTPEEARGLDQWGRALRLLRLVESPDALTTGSLEDFLANVAGYYDTETGIITIVDRGTPTRDEEAAEVFAHELTHYVQDIDPTAGFAAHEGVDTSSLDSYDALRHHGEGEAVVVGNLVLDSLRGLSTTPARWRQYYADWLVRERADIAASADPYIAVRTRLKYVVGGAYLSDAWAAGGVDALRAQWTPAILDTANWMRGFDSRLPLERFVECDLPSAPVGYSVAADDRLGAEMLFPMLVPEGVSQAFRLEAAWDDARSWRGDHLRVFVSSSAADPDAAPVALAYRVRTDSLERVLSVADRLRQSLGEGVVVVTEGFDVLVLAAEDTGTWTGWSYPLACTGLPMLPSPRRLRSLADRLPQGL
jgi:hypothetical protein